MDWSFPQVAYEFPEKRQLCENCKRPSKVCFCDVIPEEKLDHSTTVCILQHPAEASTAFCTTPFLQSCLHHVQVVSKLPPEWKLLQEQDLVLFPSDTSTPVENISRGKYRLFVIDGTWSSAKKLYKKHEHFQQRRNVFLSRRDNIPLFLLRKPPSNIVNAYCTAEAVATALYWLEQDEAKGSKIYHTIRNCVRKFCEKQMQYISKDSVRHRRQNQGYIEQLYEQWES